MGNLEGKWVTFRYLSQTIFHKRNNESYVLWDNRVDHHRLQRSGRIVFRLQSSIQPRDLGAESWVCPMPFRFHSPASLEAMQNTGIK